MKMATQAKTAVPTGLAYEKVKFVSFGKVNYQSILNELARNSVAAVAENHISVQLSKVLPFPTPYEFAQFAELTYRKPKLLKTRLENGNDKLPSGWDILSTVTSDKCGSTNNFYCIICYNEKARQILIAVRDSKFHSNEVLLSNDLICNNYTPEINYVCTVAHSIAKEIREIIEQKEKELGKKLPKWQILLTGHSLGGWLAQIATFSLKYLKFENGKFMMNHDKPELSIHPHTEVFDSPGCMEMLRKIANHNGLNLNLKELDITSYLSAPNLINSRNHHIGPVYRIYPKFVDYGSYTLSSSNMKGILASLNPNSHAFNFENIKIKRVVKWPSISRVLKTEDEYVKYSRMVKDYEPGDDNATFSISELNCFYQTKHELNRYKYSNAVFNQDELRFLYSLRRQIELKRTIIDNQDIQAELKKIRLRKSSVYFNVESKSFVDVLRLMVYVRALVQLNSHLEVEILDTYNSETGIQFYEDISNHHVEKIQPYAKGLKNIPFPEFEEYLISDQVRLLNVDVNGCNYTVAALMLKKFENSSVEDYYKVVMKVQDFLTVEKLFSFKDFLKTKKKTIVILDYKIINDVGEVEYLVKLLEDIVKFVPTCKIVLISPNSLRQQIMQISDQLQLGEKCKFTSHEGITWNDITPTFQEEILETELITVQGGSNYSLKHLFEDEERRRVFLQPNILSKLMKRNSISIGNPLENLQEHYLPREYEYFTETETKVYTEPEVLIEIASKPTSIISGRANCGKSTALTAIAKGLKDQSPLSWILRINFNDCVDVLKKAIPHLNLVTDPKKTVEFFIDEILNSNPHTMIKNPLEIQVLEDSILKYGNVSILWDGFDELPIECHKVALKLLQNLRKTKIDHIIVSSRPKLVGMLAKSLETSPLQMRPFNKADVKKYLSKFCEKHSWSDICVEKLNMDIVGIPFHCKLLAEYGKGNPSIIENVSELEDLTLLELYEYYIEERLPSLDDFEETSPSKITNTLIRNQLYQHALELLVPAQIHRNYPYKILDPDLEAMVHLEMFKTGLMKPVKSKPKFTNRSIAEYYIYHYFEKLSAKSNFEQNGVHLKNLSLEILLKPEFRITRKFFNDKLKFAKNVEGFVLLKMYVFLVNHNWPGYRGLCVNYLEETALQVLLKERLQLAEILLKMVDNDIVDFDIKNEFLECGVLK